MQQCLAASLALVLVQPVGALADTGSDIQALRSEIEALRKDYEARLQSLELRLRATEAAAATPPAAAAPTAPTQAPLASAEPGGRPTGANALNPAISLILAGRYTRTSQDPERWAITGVPRPAGGEFGPGTRGFSLAETELGLAASIDPWLRGVANIALHGDDAVSVEEAYVETTSLGQGLVVKAGRFLSGVGYLNPQHAHTWDFADSPLAYQAFLGTQFGDDGVRITWLAPTETYLEVGAELGRGRGFPGSDTGRNGAGMSALSAHAGGDVGDSHSWRAGLSVLDTKASDQALFLSDATGSDFSGVFNGNTRVWVADAVWKWAPHGNAKIKNFKLQGEFLRSRRDGGLTPDDPAAGGPSAYRLVQSGWYLQAVYQFMPRWRVGLRTERLNAGTPDFGGAPAPYGADGFKPRKHTLMVDLSPSEFSRVRLQFARDQARVGASDNQITVQYQTSLGAHGAHGF